MRSGDPREPVAQVQAARNLIRFGGDVPGLLLAVALLASPERLLDPVLRCGGR